MHRDRSPRRGFAAMPPRRSAPTGSGYAYRAPMRIAATRALRLALVVGVLALAGCGAAGSGAAPAAPSGASATAPAALTPTAPGAVPDFSHVFVIVLENTAYSTLFTQQSPAPYLRSLVARGALQTAYYAVAHPSLPNYLALVSGGTQGVTSDCTHCFVHATNLADQVEASGRTWRAYMESMPAPCSLGNESTYVQRHDPWVYFDDIRTDPARCDAHVVSLTQLSIELAGGDVPNLVWITPNVCHDMHSCSIGTGDAWLRGFLPSILNSPAFLDHGVLFITFDEGTTNAGCCGDSHGGRVFTLVLGPDVRAGFQSHVPETHYSLLRTIEDAWGLTPLGHAASATPLTEDFRR